MKVVYYFLQVFVTPASMEKLRWGYSNFAEASMVYDNTVVSFSPGYFNHIDDIGVGFGTNDAWKDQQNWLGFVIFLVRVDPVQ